MKKKIKILYDISWPDKTGIGLVQREYLQRLKKDFEVIPVDFKISKRNILYPILMSLRINKIHHDLFITPGFFPPFFKTRSIVFFHDLGHIKNYSLFHRFYMTAVGGLYKKLDLICFVSNTVRDEFIKWNKSILKKTQSLILYNGISSHFYKQTDNTYNKNFKEPFFFYPANHRRHKNHNLLYEAISLLNKKKIRVSLYVTGKFSKQEQQLINKLQITNNIFCTGDLSSDEIKYFYKNSIGLVFPSTYEGFGIPLLEAFYFKKPIACSNIAVFNEIASDAALFFNPSDPVDISRKLKLIIDGKYSLSYVEKGKALLEKFNYDLSYTKLKKQIIDILNA